MTRRLTVGTGLVLQRELAAVIGVGRQRAAQLAESPSFPKPAAHTVGGVPLWRRDVIEAWNAPRSRKGGRPAKS